MAKAENGFPSFDTDTVGYFAVNTHARHTMASMLRFGTGGSDDWGTAFLKNCPKGSVPSPLVGWQHQSNSGILLSRGWLDQDVFVSVAKQLSARSDPGETRGGIKLRDLASPLIPAEIVTEMAQENSENSALLAILSANPNWRLPNDPFEILSSAEKNIHLQSLTQYGNLKDANVVQRLLVDVVKNDRELVPKHLHLRTLECLCKRSEIPEVLAIPLDTIADSKGYEHLIKTPAHRALVRENRVFAHNYQGNHNETLHISPEASQKQLKLILEQLKNLSDVGTPGKITKSMVVATVGAHPNGIEEWRLAARDQDTPSVYGSIVRESSAKWASAEADWLYRAGKMTPYGLASAKDPSPRCLLDAAEKVFSMGPETIDHCMLKLLSHPCFPWKNLPESSPIRTCETKRRLEIECSEAMSGELSSFKIEEMATKNPIIGLFSSSLTSARLEKIANSRPDLAPVCALHPNGHSVKIETIPEVENRNIVTHLRAEEVELAGLSGATSQAQSYVLEM